MGFVCPIKKEIIDNIMNTFFMLITTSQT